MTDELQKKVDRAIKLIQQAGRDGQVVEVAYSGGKDSDVILELTRMAGIKYRAIYKNTTIDPPGTIAHAKENEAEILRPLHSFFEIIEEHGFPNRMKRFCCKYLKEFKVLDRSIMGVRRAESTKRAARYSEPTECRFYGSKKEHVEAFYPILDWTNDDVVNFVIERNIKLHPLYYRDNGTIEPTRRLGCLCCPLAYKPKRIQQFKEHPNMVKAYIRAGQSYMDKHPRVKEKYSDVYTWFVRDVFYPDVPREWEQLNNGIFAPPNYREFLENYFNIKFTLKQ